MRISWWQIAFPVLFALVYFGAQKHDLVVETAINISAPRQFVFNAFVNTSSWVSTHPEIISMKQNQTLSKGRRCIYLFNAAEKIDFVLFSIPLDALITISYDCSPATHDRVFLSGLIDAPRMLIMVHWTFTDQPDGSTLLEEFLTVSAFRALHPLMRVKTAAVHNEFFVNMKNLIEAKYSRKKKPQPALVE